MRKKNSSTKKKLTEVSDEFRKQEALLNRLYDEMVAMEALNEKANPGASALEQLGRLKLLTAKTVQNYKTVFVHGVVKGFWESCRLSSL